MRSFALLLCTALATVLGHAQADPFSAPAPRKAAPGAAEEGSFAKLKGISFFYIDVTTSDSRPEDTDLRSEIRDTIELEMRRANITPKEIGNLAPETATPLLTIDVRFDRGLGRYNADVILSIRDNATITRNKEPVIAQAYAQARRASGTSDNTLSRDAKIRGRELVLELIEGMKKLK